MASQKASKLNQLHRVLPEGLLVDAAWLEARGYSHPLRQKYVTNGWLEMLARGVYRRPAAGLGHRVGRETLDWRRVVLSLNSLLDYDLHVGGRTAAELVGISHYLPVSDVKSVQLYAEKLPGWLHRLPTNVSWQTHRPSALFDLAALAKPLPALKLGRATADPTLLSGRGHISVDAGSWTILVSLPERAILELLDELPANESFEYADKFVEGLANVRPRIMQHLLEACSSIKVKRLFLFLADRHRHAWLNKLDKTRIDLGSGKRALVPSGRYDKTYQITVPDFLMQADDAG
jgi:hypothetical protein